MNEECFYWKGLTLYSEGGKSYRGEKKRAILEKFIPCGFLRYCKDGYRFKPFMLVHGSNKAILTVVLARIEQLQKIDRGK